MSRLIDADFMQEKAYQMNFDRKISERELFLFNRALSEMPTVDAVPVVRCRECKWWKPNAIGICKLHDIRPTPIIMDNWFCGDGERKEQTE